MMTEHKWLITDIEAELSATNKIKVDTSLGHHSSDQCPELVAAGRSPYFWDLTQAGSSVKLTTIVITSMLKVLALWLCR